jgi:hypothetical protein
MDFTETFCFCCSTTKVAHLELCFGSAVLDCLLASFIRSLICWRMWTLGLLPFCLWSGGPYAIPLISYLADIVTVHISVFVLRKLWHCVATVYETRNQAVQLIIEDIVMCVAKASHWQPVKTFDFGRYIILKMCYKTSVWRLSLVNSLLHVWMYLTPVLFLISPNIIEVFN